MSLITDGQENSSRTFTKAEIKEKIETQSNVWKWNFIFLGANVDSFDEAQQLGMSVQAAANFAQGKVFTAYAVASQKVARYRAGKDARELNWTAAERQELMEDKK